MANSKPQKKVTTKKQPVGNSKQIAEQLNIEDLNKQAKAKVDSEKQKKVAQPTEPEVVEIPVKQTTVPQKKTRPQAEPTERTVGKQATLKNNDKKRAKKHKKKGSNEKRQLFISTNSAPFAYTEAYKALRTNLNFISATENVKSIIITSAIPREAKSNVAINIAITMANEGKRVIIVDCDFRKPALHRYLKMGRSVKGVTDILAGEADVNGCTIHFKDAKIYALPAGTIPPNPSEMLAQERMKKLIELLKENYDFVILDAPPISVVTDAAILGHYVDGAILVVRSKFAPKETIQLAKKKLEDVDIRILGVVLTRFNSKKSSKNSAYSYTYDYGYGYGDEND